jgi:cytochrome c oxidase subunit 3
LNVLILFFSGALVTASLDSYKRVAILKNLTICIVLGVIFIMIQYIEFSTAKFTITDSLYGTVFFSLTGLLGILMIFGVAILVVC